MNRPLIVLTLIGMLLAACSPAAPAGDTAAQSTAVATPTLTRTPLQSPTVTPTLSAAHVMTTINNLVLGLLLRQGGVNVPDARRYYDANPEEAIELLLLSPT